MSSSRSSASKSPATRPSCSMCTPEYSSSRAAKAIGEVGLGESARFEIGNEIVLVPHVGARARLSPGAAARSPLTSANAAIASCSEVVMHAAEVEDERLVPAHARSRPQSPGLGEQGQERLSPCARRRGRRSSPRGAAHRSPRAGSLASMSRGPCTSRVPRRLWTFAPRTVRISSARELNPSCLVTRLRSARTSSSPSPASSQNEAIQPRSANGSPSVDISQSRIVTT